MCNIETKYLQRLITAKSERMLKGVPLKKLPPFLVKVRKTTFLKLLTEIDKKKVPLRSCKATKNIKKICIRHSFECKFSFINGELKITLDQAHKKSLQCKIMQEK